MDKVEAIMDICYLGSLLCTTRPSLLVVRSVLYLRGPGPINSPSLEESATVLPLASSPLWKQKQKQLGMRFVSFC